MIAQNLMNPQPLTLRPTDTVATGADYILKHRLRHVPVVDEQGRYVGTFSIYSLLRLTLPKAVSWTKASTTCPSSRNRRGSGPAIARTPR